MPDHWHGLVQPGDGELLSAIVRRLKCNSARQVRTHLELESPVWAPAFHDRALRDEDTVASAARYVVMNPIRAGLALSPGNYPYWDAAWIGDLG
jgi:REP element-mobilizing transposase RayT